LENIIPDLTKALLNAFIYTVDLSAGCMCWCYSGGSPCGNMGHLFYLKFLAEDELNATGRKKIINLSEQQI